MDDGGDPMQNNLADYQRKTKPKAKKPEAAKPQATETDAATGAAATEATVTGQGEKA